MPQILLPAKLESCVQAVCFLQEHLAPEYARVLPAVELSVEELLTNVARHAYAREPHPGERPSQWGMLELGVRLVRLDGVPCVGVWLRDWGRPFDPFAEARKPDIAQALEDRPLGGLGVHLVRNMASHHCYCASDGANTTELFFDVAPANTTA